MTTAASNWLSTHDWADIGLVLLFDGLDLGITTSSDDVGLSAAWAATSSNQWTTIKSGLAMGGAVSQEISIMNAQIRPSNLTFQITDHDDALIRLMFGEARSDIVKLDLATSLDSNDVFLTTVQDLNQILPGVATSGPLYVGTETIQGVQLMAGSPGLAICNRGQRSLGGTSSSASFGRPHTINTLTGDKPIVSSQPIVWYNRTVGLYVCHRVNGVWSAGLPGSNANDSQLLWMGRIKSWDENGAGLVSISAVEITERLQTTLMSQQYTGKMTDGRLMTDADCYITTSCVVTDTSTGLQTFFFPTPAANQFAGSGTTMTADDIVGAVNAYLTDQSINHAATFGPAIATIGGQPTLTDGYKFHLRYTAGPLAVEFALTLRGSTWRFIGFPASDNSDGNAVNILDLSGDGVTTDTELVGGPPKHAFIDAGNNHGVGGIFFTIQPDDGLGSFTPFYRQDFAAFSSLPGFGAADCEGFLVLNEKTIVGVKQVDTNTFQFLIDVSQFFAAAGSEIVGFGDLTFVPKVDTIKVSQVWIEQGSMGTIMLRLMASTGTAGYNHPTYDSYPSWMSVGCPWTLMDTNSILNLEQSQYTLLIAKPTPFAKLIEGALNFAGKQLVFADGKIKIVNTAQGALGADSLVALTEDNKATQVRSADAQVSDRTTVDRNTTGIINRLTLKYNQAIDGSFTRTLTVNATASQTDYEQAKGAVIDGIGIYDGAGFFPGILDGSLTTWVRNVTATALAYFSQPVATLTRSYDFNLATKLFPGVRVSITDSSLVDPSTGTRGVTNLLGWVLSTQFDWTSGVGKVQVVFQPTRASDRFTLWGPSGRVDQSSLIVTDPTFTNVAAVLGLPPLSALSIITPSVTPSANKLQILCVQSGDGGVNVGTIPTATGCGLTWSNIYSRQLGAGPSGDTRITVFTAQSSTPSTGSVTVSFALAQGRPTLNWIEVGNVSGSGGQTGFHDTAVSLTSASMSFLVPSAFPFSGVVAFTATGTTTSIASTTFPLQQISSNGGGQLLDCWVTPSFVQVFTALFAPTSGGPNFFMLEVVSQYTGGGYDVATKTLTLLPHQYSLSSEGVDASNFEAGDAVHIVELSPDNPNSPQVWSDVLASVDPATNTVVLVGGIAGFSPLKQYNLEYGSIVSATADQKGFHSFLADPTSKSTGLAPNDAYLWGGDIDTHPDAPYTFTAPYQKANFTSDDVGTPNSVAKMGDLSAWANTALVYHTCPIYINELLSVPVTTTGAQYTTVYGPIWVPLYFGNDRFLDMRALVKKPLASDVVVRFVTSRQLPSGASFSNPAYVDVLGTSPNWASVTPAPSTDYTWVSAQVTPALGVIDGQAGTYVTIDVSSPTVTTSLYGAYVAEVPGA